LICAAAAAAAVATAATTTTLIKAVGHSVETQTVFYGKKNFKSIVAQWMSRVEL
jgi:hypothetical protein